MCRAVTTVCNAVCDATQAAARCRPVDPLPSPSRTDKRVQVLAQPHLDGGGPRIQRILHQLLHRGGQVQNDLRQGPSSTSGSANES